MNKGLEFSDGKLFAFMQDTEEIIQYTEALSPELKDKYHEEILRNGRKFVGLGYICGYNIYGELWTFETSDLIYI